MGPVRDLGFTWMKMNWIRRGSPVTALISSYLIVPSKESTTIWKSNPHAVRSMPFPYFEQNFPTDLSLVLLSYVTVTRSLLSREDCTACTWQHLLPTISWRSNFGLFNPSGDRNTLASAARARMNNGNSKLQSKVIWNDLEFSSKILGFLCLLLSRVTANHSGLRPISAGTRRHRSTICMMRQSEACSYHFLKLFSSMEIFSCWAQASSHLKPINSSWCYCALKRFLKAAMQRRWNWTQTYLKLDEFNEISWLDVAKPLINWNN